MPTPGVVGPWKMNASFISPSGETWIATQDGDLTGVTFDVTESDNGFIRGDLFGELYQFNDPTDPGRVTSTAYVTGFIRAAWEDITRCS